MLEIIVKLLCSLYGSVAGALIISNLLKQSFKINIQNIFLLIILSIITTMQFTTKYAVAITLLSYITTIFIYKLMFKSSFKKSILTCGVMMGLVIISDMLWSLVVLKVFPNTNFRNTPSVMIITNILVYGSAYLLSCIKIINSRLQKFVLKADKSKIYSQYVFIIISVVVLSIIVYDFTSSKILGLHQYILTLSTFLLMLILAIIYIKSRNENDKLQEKFDYLYDYSKNHEEWISKEQLNIHEHKNQLIVIRDMLDNNSEARKYINDILEEDFELKNKWLGQISNLPKGGLKGLLYYKLITIEKNNLNFCVDISNNSKNKLIKIQEDQLKDISHLIGIYLDNAIEASALSKKKMISIEIYCIKDVLNIVISNSFDNNIDISKLSTRGYTTKGKGHGNGLYLASKIINNNSNIMVKTDIINKYFVQKIIIN